MKEETAGCLLGIYNVLNILVLISFYITMGAIMSVQWNWPKWLSSICLMLYYFFTMTFIGDILSFLVLIYAVIHLFLDYHYKIFYIWASFTSIYIIWVFFRIFIGNMIFSFANKTK